MTSEFLDQALNNIDEGLKKIKDQKGRVIAPSVADALRDFCRQEPAFAQTVAEDGGFDKCIADVVKGVGSSNQMQGYILRLKAKEMREEYGKCKTALAALAQALGKAAEGV